MLETLSAMVQETDGRVSAISVGRAEYVVRLAEASPSLPPWFRWVLANRYQACEESGESTQWMDLLVAFEPWKDDDAWFAYRDAVRSGAVEKPVAADLVLGSDFENRHHMDEVEARRRAGGVNHGGARVVERQEH